MFVNFNILNQLGSPAINSNTFANRPAAGQTGRLFVSTDTYEIYRDNGTTWDLIGGPGSSTITGTGTATQVAYFTSSQAIGSSANLFWDNTNTRLGVGTAAPGYTIEANGDILAEAIYLDGATAGNGALYWTSDRVTIANYNAAGIVHIETNGGAAAAIFGADYTATFTSGIGTRGYTGSTSYGALFNGSVGINTATPGAALDVHSTGTIAQFNTTSATGNTYIAFQRTGTGLWRIGDTYNAGNNFFELHNTVLGTDALEFEAATNKSTFQAQQTYTTGLARGNYFDYNLSVAAGGSFSSPNAITALTATLDLTLAGNATIPSGARSGLDAYNTIAFTGAGTLTHSQGTQIRAYSNLTAGWAFNGSAIGTITHLAGLRALFPDNSGSAVNVTNNYALLLNDQTANTGTVTYTNRWGIYQEGASDLNYLNANLLLGSTVNNGNKLQVAGNANFTGNVSIGTTVQYTTLTLANANVPALGVFRDLDVTIVGPAGQGIEFGAKSSGTFLPGGAIYGQLNNPDTTGALIFQTRTAGVLSTKAFLNSNGYFGIGTSTPSSILDLSDTSPELTLTRNNNATTAAGLINWKTSNGTLRWNIGTNSVVGSGFEINYGVSNFGYVTTGGNFLFGTTTDAGQKLQVNGTALFSNTVNISASVSATSNVTLLNLTNSSDGGVKINFSNSVTSELASIIAAVSGTGAGTDDGKLIFRTSLNGTTSDQLTISSSGAATFSNTITTAAPTTGTAAPWKLGSRVAATVVVNTTEYIEVDIGGTLYKLATVT